MGGQALRDDARTNAGTRLPDRSTGEAPREGEQAIERLELFGPRLPFPDSSAVKGTEFRELRTRFAGQQYRVLYLQDGEAFILFDGFHKTSDRDLDRAVREANKHLADYRSEQS
jgi:hypothetical protein